MSAKQMPMHANSENTN